MQQSLDTTTPNASSVPVSESTTAYLALLSVLNSIVAQSTLNAKSKVSSAKQESRRRALEKTKAQLGENPRTASHKLQRSIIFSLLRETGRDTCFRCKADLTEDSFSIDHAENWLDSEDPRGLFFDVKNIDFSCKLCNTANNRGIFRQGGGRGPTSNEVLVVRKPLDRNRPSLFQKILHAFK